MSLLEIHNKKKQRLKIVGLMSLLFVLLIILVFIWSCALSASAAESNPDNGGNLFYYNGHVYKYPVGTVYFNKQTGLYTLGPFDTASKLNYYVYNNGSFNSVYEAPLSDAAFVISGRVQIFNNVNNTIHLFLTRDYLLVDNSLTSSVPMVPSTGYTIYYQDSRDYKVHMLESASVFTIDYKYSERAQQFYNYVSSDSTIYDYVYNDGWQQSSVTYNNLVVDTILRVTGDEFRSSVGFSIFAFAFKGELDSDSPETTPTPSPSLPSDFSEIRTYFDLVYHFSQFSNYYIYVGKKNFSGYFSVHVSLYGDLTYFEYFHYFNFDSSYNCIRNVAATGSYNIQTYPGYTNYTNRYNEFFDSSDVYAWPYVTSENLPDIGTPTPSPIPTYIPTSAPGPSSLPLPSPEGATPTSFDWFSDNPNFITSPPSFNDDLHDSFNSIDFDTGDAFGLWARAISFMPDNLVGALWIFVAMMLLVTLLWVVIGW